MNKDKYLRLDSCIARFIEHLNLSLKDVETVGSCCGHGIYPMTIIVRDKYNQHYDLVSGVHIKRKKRYYVKDKRGYYFIPEVVDLKNSATKKVAKTNTVKRNDRFTRT